MASYSDILLLSDFAQGETSEHGFADWGAMADSNFAFLEDTIGEVTSKTLASSDVTLTAAEERSLFVNLSGTLGANVNVQTNDRKGFWVVYNGTSGAFTVTFKTASGSGATVDQGEYALMISDGTDILKVVQSNAAIAASLITSGVLAHERGGLEADVSAYDGLVKVTGGSTSAVTITSAGEALLDDADASAMRTTLGLAIGSDVQGYDADTLKADTADVLTASFEEAVDDDGAQSSGTYTPSVGAGSNSKKIVNGGAFTLGEPAPSANDTALYISLLIVNNASAGAITTSAFDVVTGDDFTTTDGHVFKCRIDVTDIGGTHYSHLDVVAYQ